MRVIDYFDRGARAYPDRACLIDCEVTKTYREVEQRSHCIANALISAGFNVEHKAAVLAPNGAVAFECVLGILRAEGAWVPVSIRNAAAENAYLIGRLDVTVLFFHSALADQVAVIRAQCPGLGNCVCIDQPAVGAHDLEAWISGRSGPSPERGAGPDALATISGTGGTTGRPKGVMWTHRTWQTFVANFHAAFPVRRPPVYLVVAPMTHAAGTFGIVLMAAAASVVILPGFDAQAVMVAIERHRVTTLFLPPTAIYSLLAHPEVRRHDYSSLEYFFYTAAPMSTAKLREAIEVFGPVMSSMYGQVEAPATCTCLPPWELVRDGVIDERLLGSCGRPSLHTRVAIMDEQGRLLPAGDRGEVVVRGGLVMRGYYRDEAATAEVSRFGWHHTGDIGYQDDDGYLFIVDRNKDMIITGGFNVYSTEVEQALASHPAVLDCAVIGVPDEKWGEAVTAIVVLKPGQAASEAELIEFAKRQLGSVKAPKCVELWDALPRSAAGKVLKKVIRDGYWKGAGRRI